MRVKRALTQREQRVTIETGGLAIIGIVTKADEVL